MDLAELVATRDAVARRLVERVERWGETWEFAARYRACVAELDILIDAFEAVA